MSHMIVWIISSCNWLLEVRIFFHFFFLSLRKFSPIYCLRDDNDETLEKQKMRLTGGGRKRVQLDAVY